VAVTATPRVVHSLPGRLRIHAPEWARAEAEAQARLRALDGVDAVRASAATGNVLVHFDAQRLDADRVLDALGAQREQQPATSVEHQRSRPRDTAVGVVDD
jgi:hypothetical protein